MSTKKSMDIFGEALLAYTAGDRSTFYLKDENGVMDAYSLAERFRPYSKLNETEKKLIALSRGDILDVGCGTGNVIPALEKKGRVIGIDISRKVIEVAKKRGCNTCYVADIFSHKFTQKFDTITLFGNNLGIGGTVSKMKRLLSVLKGLLKSKGQILAITPNYSNSEYREMTLTPIWNDTYGPAFNWIIFDNNFLLKLCKEQGLHLEVVTISWRYRLVRMTAK